MIDSMVGKVKNTGDLLGSLPPEGHFHEITKARVALLVRGFEAIVVDKIEIRVRMMRGKSLAILVGKC